MKYFTKELWSNLSEESTWKKWEKNIKAYKKQLTFLQPHLTKKSQAFFNNISLHDSLILSITFGDLFNKQMTSSYNFAEINVRKYETGFDYKLRYTKLGKCVFDFPSDHPMQDEDIFSFGEWSYDELSLGNDGLLTHEILFSSGSTLLIKFKHFTYSRKKY